MEGFVNINDYNLEEEVAADNLSYMERLHQNDINVVKDDEIFFKSRPDSFGVVKRIEGDNVIVNIFDENYAFPIGSFNNMFHIKEKNSPLDWYRKTTSKNTNWYVRCKTAALIGDDLKFVKAQELLMKVCQDIPEGHPLKGRIYVAGGAVRDEIMGKIPKDIDVTVEVKDGGVVAANYFSEKLSLKPPAIHENFGTAQIVLKDTVYKGETYGVDGIDIELVQTRKEQYPDPETHKPIVTFGTLAEDVERRDFTVNSLVKDLETGEILDLTGKGIQDISDGIIRTPIDPDVIFFEDPTRMMRAMRFAAKYGWEITPEVKESIRRNVDRIDIVAGEKIAIELNKIATVAKMHDAIHLMDEVGLLEKVLPEMHALKGVQQDTIHHSEGDAYVHTLLVIENMEKEYPDIGIAGIWAAIAHDWGKANTQTFVDDRIKFLGHEASSKELVELRLRELKFPNDIIDKVSFLVENHMRGHGPSHNDWGDKTYRKYIREMGDHYDEIMALLHADELSSIPGSGNPRKSSWEEIIRRREQFADEPVAVKPPINGYDIMNEFAAKGPQIGVVQKILTDLIDNNPSLAVAEKEVVFQAIRDSGMLPPELVL